MFDIAKGLCAANVCHAALPQVRQRLRSRLRLAPLHAVQKVLPRSWSWKRRVCLVANHIPGLDYRLGGDHAPCSPEGHSIVVNSCQFRSSMDKRIAFRGHPYRCCR